MARQRENPGKLGYSLAVQSFKYSVLELIVGGKAWTFVSFRPEFIH